MPPDRRDFTVTTQTRHPIAVDPAATGFPDRIIGGWSAGLLAGADPFEVRFHAPVRPGAETFVVTEEDRRLMVDANGTVLSEGRHWLPKEPQTPPPPTAYEAAFASASYTGHRVHLFPDCFCCGPRRPHAEGLHVYPALVAGEQVAALWRTPELTAPEVIWASLDCPAIWALIHASESGCTDRIVSGTMSTQIFDAVTPNTDHVIHAWKLGEEGRRRFTGAALRDVDGRLLAFSRQTFIVTEQGVPIDRDLWLD